MKNPRILTTWATDQKRENNTNNNLNHDINRSSKGAFNTFAFHKSDQKQENPMNHNPIRGNNRKEKRMNLITKALSLAVPTGRTHTFSHTFSNEFANLPPVILKITE